MSPSATIFAALDAAGVIRFIGDVASGGACGCFCSVCGSSLVARQGNVNTWHFAHDARQERPECIPGAVNLLRRLAAEYLRSLPRLDLPTYRTEIIRSLPSGRAVEVAEWDAQPLAISWLEPATQDAPIARLTLDNDVVAELFVEIAEAKPVTRYPSSSNIGRLSYWATLPVDSDLRKALYARQHLKRSGRLVWMHQPDVYGLVADAQKRMADRAASEDHAATARAARERQALDAWRSRAAPAPEPALPTQELPPWALHKKPLVSFFAYRYNSGEAWVIFELAQGGYGMRQLDGAEGWEESVPISGGRFDPLLQLVVSETRPDMSMGQRPRATRISSDFEDIAKV